MPALLAVERLGRAFVDQKTGIGGYVLTRQEVLEPYRQPGAGIAEHVRCLRTGLPDEPCLVRRLRAGRHIARVAPRRVILQLAHHREGRPVTPMMRMWFWCIRVGPLVCASRRDNSGRGASDVTRTTTIKKVMT